MGHYDPSLLQEKCLSSEILPSGGSWQLGGWLAGPCPCLSHPSQCSPFYLLLWGAVHLVFKSFFQREMIRMYLLISCVLGRRGVQYFPTQPSWTLFLQIIFIVP